MTTEEKLEHFYDVSVGEAKAEADKLLEDYKKDLDKQFAAHKKEKAKERETIIKTESDRASREINKALSSSQLEIKRHWTKKQNALKDQLFSEVMDLLKDFMKTPGYDKYLAGKIAQAMEFAQDDELNIYLAPGDRDKLSALSLQTGHELEISSEDFIGGIRATIPHKNILIDNSFQGAYQQARQEFNFDGGLTYE